MSRWIAAGAVLALVVGMSTASLGTGQAQGGPGGPRLDDWVSVAAANGDQELYGGATHSCGIREDGSLWCWGMNNYGVLGLGDTTNRYRPNQVGTDTDWLSVSVGESDTCAIEAPGTLWCWGLSFHSTVPVRVGDATDWQSISLGGYQDPHDRNFRCGVRGDTSLWCWGDNSDGQLGLGDTEERSEPTEVSDGWHGVSAGLVHTCGVRVDGSLWCWGGNSEGQLGVGDQNQRRVPTQVDAGSLWDTVAAGAWHTCGIHQDGSLWCWGLGSFGELGNGQTDTQDSPVRVGSRSDWSDVGAGSYHSCATRTDGSLWCFGRNDDGQVGIGGSPLKQLTPARVGTASWTALATGDLDSCGVQSDQTLWCWGSPLGGELGVGNRTVHTAVPVQVGLPNDPRLVSYSLSDVDATGSDDVWAVGESQTIRGARTFVERWDGNSWKRSRAVNVGDSTSFAAVDALSAQDVWAVGSFGDGGSQHALAEHWDGSSWSKVTVNDALGAVLTSVSAYASNDVWAVGYTTHNLWYATPIAYHYNGRRWTSVDTSPDPLWSAELFFGVEMVSPTDVWAVGYGRKDDEGPDLPLSEHWDGKSWANVPVSSGGEDYVYLRGVAASPTSVWAVGDWTTFEGEPEHALGRRWTGSRWANEHVPGVRTDLRGIDATGDGDVWAVGRSPGDERSLAFTVLFDGQGWNKVSTPSPPRGDAELDGVAAAASNDSWAVGSTQDDGVSEPLIEHWDGSAWTIVQRRYRR